MEAVPRCRRRKNNDVNLRERALPEIVRPAAER
jgi:hypothetical protein